MSASVLGQLERKSNFEHLSLLDFDIYSGNSIICITANKGGGTGQCTSLRLSDCIIN